MADRLTIRDSRLTNEPEADLTMAADAELKITTIRLAKDHPMSPITSHVLDTALGKPARGLSLSSR